MESLKTSIARSMIFILGFTAMSAQVILIRESLAIFSGNELIIGMFLGIWMMLTAAGSYLVTKLFQVSGSRFHVNTFLLFSLSLLPLASLFLLATLRYLLVLYGVMPGLGQTAVVVFLSLLPFCLVSGMLFPILIQSLSALEERNLLNEGYAIESAGSIAGGLLFSLVFILVLPPFESLVLLSSFGLLMISLSLFIFKRFIKAIIVIITAIFIFSLPAIPEVAKYIDQKQFNKQEVIEIQSSPYGMLAVSKMGDQLFIYENGSPVSLGEDAILREESVHYAMLMHPEPEDVLMISGAADGSIEEALKYVQARIDYVDRDPWLLRVIEKYRPAPQNPRVRYFYQDARIFLNKTDKKYDVILVNIADPESAEMNRYFTVEFYKLLKNRLKSGGIISVSCQAAGNYMNETSRLVHSVIFNTLKTVFNHIRIIPGGKDYFLASDSTFEQSILSDYESRGINNDFVNPLYINEPLIKMRSDLIIKDIRTGTQINSDLKPYVFSLLLKQWMAKLEVNPWLIPLILLLVLVLSFIFFGPLNLGLFTGGFTASGLEFVLLLWFQVIYGNVYQMTGVIFAVFMGGLAFGSWFMGNKFKNRTLKGFLMIQGIFAFFSALITILILLFSASPLPRFPASILLPLIMILVFTTGLLTGLQFAVSATLRKTQVLKSSGESFSADLLGSAVGLMMASIYMVPLIGLPMTAMSLAGLNILAIAAIAYKNRR